MKITKSYLIKLLKKEVPEIVLPRTTRESITDLMVLCKTHAIDIETANIPVAKTNAADLQVETDIETDESDEQTYETEHLETQQVTDNEPLDESDAMFERLRASRVESVPRGTNDGFAVEVNNEPQPKERKKRKSKTAVDGFNIDGYMLLMLLDMVLPTGISYIFNLFEKNPNKKIEAYQIALNEQQTEKMQPLAERAAEALTFKMNPLTAFAVMGTLMYANNIFMLKSTKR